MSHARIIVSGAACAAALCVGGLMGPPGSALALLVTPLPGIVVGGAAGTLQATASSLAVGGLVGGILGWTTGFAFLALAGLPTALAVAMLRRACRLEPVMAVATAASLVGAVALLAHAVPDPSAWRSTLSAAWQGSFDNALTMYRELGMSAEQLAELDAARDEMAQSASRFLPAFLVVASAALWLGNLRLSSRWVHWPQLHELTRWRVPDPVIWVLIASGFAMFLPLPLLAVAASNVFAVTLACYFVQGLAIVSYFFRRLGLPRGLRIATYIVIAFQHIAAALVVALGVFDLWGDFRHLAARPADAALGSDPD